MDTESASDTDTSSTTAAPPLRARRRRRNEQPRGSAEDDANRGIVHNALASLQFFSFADHVQWAPTVVKAIDADEDEMARKTKAMRENSEINDARHSFLQHLEIGRQIEAFSKRVDQNTYNVIKDLADNYDLGLSLPYLRSILKVSWTVCRYPVLELSRMSWSEAILKIPRVGCSLDAIIANDGRVPRNIIAAQMDMHSLCVRLFLRYPMRRPGDGDGLPKTRVEALCGVRSNDAPPTDPNAYQSTSWYGRIAASLGTDVRSRLIGYDTQEAPTPAEVRASEYPQPYWEEGRDFLLQELGRVLGGLPPQNAVLMVDCFSVDPFGRLLIEIRGAYHESQMTEENLQPTLGRFELARRALSTGFAFPTFNYLVTDDLLQEFYRAREERRGAFSSDGPVYHPSLCRKNRYDIIKNRRSTRRRRYDE